MRSLLLRRESQSSFRRCRRKDLRSLVLRRFWFWFWDRPLDGASLIGIEGGSLLLWPQGGG